MSQQFSHSDWVLDIAIQIDEHHAGFCGAFLRASAEKRHVIAAFLTARPVAAEKTLDVAPLLLAGSHRAILSEAFGEPPQGLRGALRRSGSAVQEARFYRVLYKLLSKPRHTKIAKCISRLDALTLTKLRVTNMLPPELCFANVVEALHSVESTNDLVISVDLICAAGGDREALVVAIRKVRGELALARVIGRALLNCKGVKHPVPATEGYRPIHTARELHQIAAKFRNCARSYTIDLLDHEAGHAFAEVRKGTHGGVAHLRQREGNWTLEGIYGPRNVRPTSAVRQHAIEHLRRFGIHERERVASNSTWNHVRRMTTMPMLDFEFE